MGERVGLAGAGARNDQQRPRGGAAKHCVAVGGLLTERGGLQLRRIQALTKTEGLFAGDGAHAVR